MKTLIKTAGAASLLTMAVSGASVSAGVLPYLTFDQNAGWSDENETFNGGSIGLIGLFFNDPTSAPAPADTYEEMRWTSSLNGRSSFINITSFDSDDSPSSGLGGDGDALWEAGEFWVIDELVQTNNTLQVNGNPVPNPLWEADTVANLFIYDDQGVGTNPALKEDLNSKTTIEFWETSNNGACTSPNPLGTQCDDIYRIAATTLDPIEFIHMDWKYTIDFGLAPGPSTPGGGTSLICTGIAFIDPVECAGVEVTPGEIWVFTPEENPGTSSLFVTMAWRAEAVPEPSVLALFGAGILGLGLAGRRRKQRSD